MYNLRASSGFQGVDLVFSNEELNAVVQQIDKLKLQFCDQQELDETVDKLQSLRKVLCEFSYFDEIEKEVHCRMGYYELQLLMECMIIALPAGKRDVFGEVLQKPDTKRWVYKNSIETPDV